MEDRSTTITELPLEIHHEIGSYLSQKELKSTSLVSWQFFNYYSYPLAKMTVTKIEKFLKKTKKGFIPVENPPLRKLLCNVRMKASMIKAVQELEIDRDSVRDVQIILDKEFTENVFTIFPKLHSLRFIKGKEDIDLNPVYKTLILPRNLRMIEKVLSSLQKFEKIVFEVEDNNVKEILQNNCKTLKELNIREDFEQGDLEKTIPENLYLQKVTIESEGKSKNSSYTPVPSLENSKTFHLNMDFNNYFSDYFMNLFPFLTHLSLMFNESFSSHLVFTAQHLEKTWFLPKLKVFKTNYCAEQCVENLEAPNLEKLELLNMYNTYTLGCLKRFQTVTEIRASSHKASFLKTAIEFFTQNFQNVKNLEIEQEGLLDDFQINLVLNTVTKFQLLPISTGFRSLKVFGRYLQEDKELKDFDLEGYRRDSYPHVKKWQAEVNGHSVEIVFEVVRKKLSEFDFNLLE
ncbi:hypothetical protein ACFFRR_003548 [Megaselia abdita]